MSKRRKAYNNSGSSI